MPLLTEGVRFSHQEAEQDSLRLRSADRREKERWFRLASLQVIRDALSVVALWQREGVEALEEALEELAISLAQLQVLAGNLVDRSGSGHRKKRT